MSCTFVSTSQNNAYPYCTGQAYSRTGVQSHRRTVVQAYSRTGVQSYRRKRKYAVYLPGRDVFYFIGGYRRGRVGSLEEGSRTSLYRVWPYGPRQESVAFAARCR